MSVTSVCQKWTFIGLVRKRGPVHASRQHQTIFPNMLHSVSSRSYSYRRRFCLQHSYVEIFGTLSASIQHGLYWTRFEWDAHKKCRWHQTSRQLSFGSCCKITRGCVDVSVCCITKDMYWTCGNARIQTQRSAVKFWKCQVRGWQLLRHAHVFKRFWQCIWSRVGT